MGEWVYDYFGNRQAKKQTANAARKTPEERQKEFEKTYNAMSGNFGEQPVGSPQLQCLLTTSKGERRKARQEKIKKARAKAAKMPKGYSKFKNSSYGISQAADRLEKNLDEVEYARAANHTYLKYDDPFAQSLMPDALKKMAQTAPEGMILATDGDLKALNLTLQDLEPKDSNFRAAVYKLDPEVWGPENEGKYILAFRGSTTNSEDWRNDINQGGDGYSDYYRRAVKIGEQIKDSGNGDKVHLTGHSLGGGLASAASGGGNLKATTFNSAGLNKKTVARYASNPDAKVNPENISAIRVKGEVLTKMQEEGIYGLALPDAVGYKTDLEPTDKSISSDNLHSMENVIFAIEKQKQADEKTLDAAINQHT